MSQYTKEELKTGSFALLAFAAFLFMLFMIGAFRTTAGTYPIKIHYNYISGLEKGAPVRFAGHEVGKVEGVEILSNPNGANLEVSISVKKNIVLHADSEAYIDTLGLMGEKYVELTPGSSNSPELTADDILIGEDPLAIHNLVKKGMQIADKVDNALVTTESLLANANGLVADNRESIDEIILNLRDVSIEAKELARDLKLHPWKLLRKGKEKKPSGEKSRSKFLGIF